jgi:lysophospholipase
MLALILVAACHKPADSGDTDVTLDTDTGTDPDLADGFEHYDFASGTIEACSGTIAWQTWTYNEGPATANLVFSNGRTEYTDKYHHLVGDIGQPWNIVMFDHYGQGRSDGIRAHANDFDAEQACDQHAIIEELADPSLPTALWAHSMGSAISARMMELYPDSADAVVLGSALFRLDTSPYSYEDGMGLAATQVALGHAEDLYADPAPRPPCDSPDNDVTGDCELYDAFKDDPITIMGGPTYGWLDQMFKLDDRIQTDLSLLQTPILLFEAGDERVVDESAIDGTCAALNDLDGDGACEVVVWPGDRHELFNELDRADIIARATAFTEERLGL